MSFEKALNYSGLALIIGAFCAVCFTPATFLFTRLENLLIPLVFFTFAAFRQIKIELPYFLTLTGFFGFYVVSIFLNGEGMGEVSYAFRTLKILLFLILAAQLLYENLITLDKVIRGTFLVIGGITMLEYFNPMGIYEVFFPFFTHHTMEQFFRMDSVRIIGTMMNPNDNGVLINCFLAYFMSAFYYSKNKWNILFIIMGLGLILIAQSRTSLIASVAMGAVFLLTFKINRTMIISVVGLSAVGLTMMYLLEMNYMMTLLTKNPLEINELQGRFLSWNHILKVWGEHKIWGAGPFMDTFTTYAMSAPDSEYLYVLGSRGIVGLFCYLIILIYPILLFWKKRNEVTHALLAVLLSVAFIVIGITNFSILNVRIGVVYAILMGVPFSFLLFKGADHKLNLAIPSLGSLFTKKQ